MSSTKKQWPKVQGGYEPRADLDQVDDHDGSRLFVGAEATLFRVIAASMNYLSMDRPDLQHAVKEASRTMSLSCLAGCICKLRSVFIFSGDPASR